ncbi:glycosyltransferase family 9 protein [Telmatospirillum siberiense]|uniref:glycosyltransferase family 9 protein n=1 Tax=Telmatospirillum siberiense TaxID=382514 RepID=UPI0013042B10|nr:glycosyltransferase family 9 protein [Telmatospirillum siberiense]
MAQKWDCVITDIGNAKTRLAVLGAITGAHRRIGFTAAPSLYHIPLHRDPQMSVMRDNLRLPAALGLRSEAAEPRVFFSQYEALAAETLLSQHGLTDAAGLTVFFTQTSGGQPSRWYDERFAIVADHLATRHDSAIIFGGTRGERDAIERIRSLMTRASINIAGDTKTVSVLAALLCRADMAVSLDTGPMHLARAAGLPTVVIAPAWQPAYEWLPLGFDDCTIVRRNEIPCAGCRKFVCETRECMDEITTEEVISATEALWLRYPPSPLRRQERTARSLAARREMTNAKG